MMILPTIEELDTAYARAREIYIRVIPCSLFPVPGIAEHRDFEGFCRAWAAHHDATGTQPGLRIDPAVIGPRDARLLAAGFDFAMQQLGCRARAIRVGF